MAVASGEQRVDFGAGKFVGRAVEAALFHERQRAVVHDKMFRKEIWRVAESLREQSPQALTADLAAGTVESRDWPFGMLGPRLVDSRAYFHPVAHRLDFAKGHAGLGHAPGTRIHAEKDDAFGPASKRSHVSLMAGP